MWLAGYSKPFDRHDWIVRRENGEEVRYIIDFYRGRSIPGAPAGVAVHLDVRPAIDSVPALVDRLAFGFRKMFYVTSLPVASLGSYKYFSALKRKE